MTGQQFPLTALTVLIVCKLFTAEQRAIKQYSSKSIKPYCFSFYLTSLWVAAFPESPSEVPAVMGELEAAPNSAMHSSPHATPAKPEYSNPGQPPAPPSPSFAPET
jgi:hypothetical protein